MKNLIDLFFPSSCVLCGSHLVTYEKTVCITCEHQLPFTEFTNFKDNPIEKKLWGRIPIQSATSLLFFRKNGNTQKLIHQLKYHGNQEIGTYFGTLLGNELKKSTRFQNLDGIVMVPLHPTKLKMRGYNQLSFFAKQLSLDLNIPIINDVLIKVSQTESQTKKDRLHRFTKLNEKFHHNNLEKISNKHILLIDDVLTTGATLEACAQELLKGNNVKISLAIMAIPDH